MKKFAKSLIHTVLPILQADNAANVLLVTRSLQIKRELLFAP